MAANKFATMLHNRTNKITLILIYAVLEWILITLLLLNSLFSYLIIKFADYFGLKRPCLWCSRVDHLLEPGKRENFYGELVCENHASEISKLGYCSNHRKLAESQSMCEDCSSSAQPSSRGLSKKITFMIEDAGEKMNLKCSCCGVSLEKAGVDDGIEEGDILDQTRSDFVIDHSEEERRIEENRVNDMLFDVDGIFDGRKEKGAEENGSPSASDSDFEEKKGAIECNRVDFVTEKEQEPFEEEFLSLSREDPCCDESMIQAFVREDASLEILPQHLDFYVDNDDFHLIPVESIHSTATKRSNENKSLGDDLGFCENQEAQLDSELHEKPEFELVVESGCNSGEDEQEPKVAGLESMELDKPENSSGEQESKVAGLESMELDKAEHSLDEQESKAAGLESTELAKNRNSSVPQAGGDLIKAVCEEVAITQATQTLPRDVDDAQATEAAAGGEMNSAVHPASEVVVRLGTDEINAEISMGSEIPDQELSDEIGTQDFLSSYPCMREDPFPSTSSAKLPADDDHGCKKVEEEIVEFQTMSNDQSSMCPELNKLGYQQVEEELIECKTVPNNHLSMPPDLKEIEEEKVPDTPNSLDHLHKRLLLPEKRDLGTEESLDGSVISEFEASEGVLTVEHLKSALRAERKALNALYAELEEERSASAVAANQTMAMINRLQEEKAAMQMEALQYQRMMEEQSEYDQEALQLLNELMVKREKEKQELEKELELYRKKLMDYETKEKMMILRRRRDGSSRSRTSTASCSNTEDSDGLSVDLNHEGKEEDSFCRHQESGNHSTPVDAVLNLDESLANFEEERISILEQLKILEEKLFTLADEEERHFEDMKPFEQFYEENGKEFEHFDLGCDVNGIGNGFPKDMDEKLQEERTMGLKAKTLLPLFDAISAGTEDGTMNGHEQGFESIILHPSVTKFELNTKKLAIEDEVDHLYERLQALEADREFLKHCIGSLKKGDRGMDLLEEILQHLRDLRNVELRVKKMGDGTLV
ncbi:myosin-binding protein 2 isoform X2 [Malania oleifera]|uniref:myosin-binding protein 2 isoform X2 n=1 Tax=Malania oleifera TaxID=397392 RepID=UPI0025ADDCA4|nr:myosin-binding protein 2 isoform X2 [Malania oleifera]